MVAIATTPDQNDILLLIVHKNISYEATVLAKDIIDYIRIVGDHMSDIFHIHTVCSTIWHVDNLH